ncbi:MAG: hypothetical protein U0694_20700 [Anaerolineae bacterium]
MEHDFGRCAGRGRGRFGVHDADVQPAAQVDEPRRTPLLHAAGVQRVRTEEVAVANGLLHITALQDFSIDMHPRRLHNSGEVQLTVTNQGNVVGNYTVQARDNENNLEFTMNYGRLRLEPGKSETVRVQILPRQSALIHGAKLLPFEVGVVGDNLQQKWEQGEVLVVAYLAAQQPIAIGYDAPQPHPSEYAASVAYAPPPQYGQYGRERGVGLTLWLIAQTLFSLSGFAALCYLLVSRALVSLIDVADIFFFVLSFALGFFALIHAFLVLFTWVWKRWALVGLLCFSLFVIPIGPIMSLIGWLLVRGKWEMFD